MCNHTINQSSNLSHHTSKFFWGYHASKYHLLVLSHPIHRGRKLLISVFFTNNLEGIKNYFQELGEHVEKMELCPKCPGI